MKDIFVVMFTSEVNKNVVLIIIDKFYVFLFIRVSFRLQIFVDHQLVNLHG